MEKYCGVCGGREPVETFKCPNCRRVACRENCWIEYHDNETGITKNICKECHIKIEKEDQKIEDEERKQYAIFWMKVLAVVVVLVGVFLVIGWTSARF